MKKIFAVLVAITMLFATLNPLGVSATGEENPFDEDFPIDIPYIG